MSTLKKSGEHVDTPVWVVQLAGDPNYYFISNRALGKVKRIRNFPDVKVAICTANGKLLGEWQAATAELAGGEGSEAYEKVHQALVNKYGWQLRAIRMMEGVMRVFGRNMPKGNDEAIRISLASNSP
ncbi:MAG: hypothetical protein AAF512_19180 [Pseudomonadota bacterium]